MPNWKWTQIADHDTLTEGPVWDGSGLLYNEVAKSTTFKWNPKNDETAIWRTNTSKANGMVFDRQGQLFVCEGGAHRVTKVDTENPEIDPEVVSKQVRALEYHQDMKDQCGLQKKMKNLKLNTVIIIKTGIPQ